MRALKNYIFCFGLCILFVASSCDNEPYDGPIITDGELSCSIANNLVDAALNDFLNSNSDNFEDNCLAYKATLEQHLLSCPEDADEILALLEDLNNCEFDSFFKVDFDNDTYFALTAEAHIGNGQITITGSRDNEVFELVVNATIEGTYQLGISNSGGNSNTATYFPDASTNDSWVSYNDGNSAMGQITITEIDYSRLKLSGTFNFTGLNNGDSKAFTNGIFLDIPFTKDNEFFALVDGVEFEDYQFIPYVNEEAEWAGFVVLNDDNSEVMDFTVHINTIPGTYSLGLIPQLPRAGYTSNPDYYYHGDGNITITAHNTDAGFLMGTFEFIAEFEDATPQSFNVTQGSFCVTYFY